MSISRSSARLRSVPPPPLWLASPSGPGTQATWIGLGWAAWLSPARSRGGSRWYCDGSACAGSIFGLVRLVSFRLVLCRGLVFEDGKWACSSEAASRSRGLLGVDGCNPIAVTPSAHVRTALLPSRDVGLVCREDAVERRVNSKQLESDQVDCRAAMRIGKGPGGAAVSHSHRLVGGVQWLFERDQVDRRGCANLLAGREAGARTCKAG